MKGNKYVYYNNGSLSKKNVLTGTGEYYLTLIGYTSIKNIQKKKKQLKTLLNLTFWTHIVYLWNKNSKITRNCIKFKRFTLIGKTCTLIMISNTLVLLPAHFLHQTKYKH